jgi:hypothetical protein
VEEVQMRDYTIGEREDAFDFMAEYSGYGDMRSYTDALGAEQVAFKINDYVFKAGAGTAVRLAPQALRSVHDDGADDAVLVLCSVRIDDPVADALTEDDFWPEG